MVDLSSRASIRRGSTQRKVKVYDNVKEYRQIATAVGSQGALGL